MEFSTLCLPVSSRLTETIPVRFSGTQSKVSLKHPNVVKVSKKTGPSFISYGILRSFRKPKDRLTTLWNVTTGKGWRRVFLMPPGRDAFRVSVGEDKVRKDGSASKKVDVRMIYPWPGS